MGRTEDLSQKAWGWSVGIVASWLADLQQVDISEPLFSDASTVKTAHSIIMMIMIMETLQIAMKHVSV